MAVGPCSTSSPAYSTPTVAEPGNDSQVVADEEDRRVELGADGGDQIEHGGFDGRVEARGWLIEDQERGLVASAMAMTARCCMPPLSWCGKRRATSAAPGIRTLSNICTGGRRAPPAVEAAVGGEDLGDLITDRHARIERRARVLVNHGDAVAAQALQVAPERRNRSRPSNLISPAATRPLAGR